MKLDKSRYFLPDQNIFKQHSPQPICYSRTLHFLQRPISEDRQIFNSQLPVTQTLKRKLVCNCNKALGHI